MRRRVAPDVATTGRSSLRALGLALIISTAGCAGLIHTPELAPNGLTRYNARLRHLLAAGRPDSAFVRIAAEREAAPDDKLLRLLYRGAVAHYAGRWKASSAALVRAAAMAENRYTESVSRGALSLLTNDRVLDYEPGRTERLLIHYYDALNYLARGKSDEAAVAASRLSHLLAQYQLRGMCKQSAAGLCATLHYFAGAVFEAAGWENDARVAYRNARAAAEAGSLRPPLPTAPDTLASDSMGDVVVVIERGFVAHRVERSLNILLGAETARALTEGGRDERREVITALAARLLGRPGALTSADGDRPEPIQVRGVGLSDPGRERECDEWREPGFVGGPDLTGADSAVGPAAGRPRPWTGSPGPYDDCGASGDESSDAVPYLLRIAWPVYRRGDPIPRARAVLAGAERAGAPVLLRADISESVINDFARERGALLARTIARAVAKYGLTRAVEEEIGEESEIAGEIVGLLMNLGGALLEHADTRSWHLLPGRIAVARLRLPPGTHTISLALPDGRTATLDTVTVRPDETSVAVGRVWR